MVRIVEHEDDADVPWPNRRPPPAAQTSGESTHINSGSSEKAPCSTRGASLDGGDEDSASCPVSMGAGVDVSDGSGRSSEAEEHKARGNECFAVGRWAEAEVHYTNALKACPAAPHQPDPPNSPEQGVSSSAAVASCGGGDADRRIAIYYANRAACYMNMGRYKEAEEDSTDAIAHDAGYVKAYLRRGAAREKLGDLEGALADNEKVANELEKEHRQATAAVARLRPAVERKREEMKEEMMGKLKDLGNSLLGNFGLSLNNFKAEKDETTGSYNIQFVQNAPPPSN